ncbi:hypothetical protein GR183_01940 [Stappia sp. GBMRC 2046]|uniref:Uncharacterized protein n=1 Tax=Stappia sediminis TaxID=2692190 RepID=A0A7X3LRB3_9HYPH|nr:hypothetical protein [Stappia sediminis]MXN63651.1 hypothetical protein [Stappia sediminis]
MSRNVTSKTADPRGGSSLQSRYMKIYLAIIIGNAVLWTVVFSFIY